MLELLGPGASKPLIRSSFRLLAFSCPGRVNGFFDVEATGTTGCFVGLRGAARACISNDSHDPREILLPRGVVLEDGDSSRIILDVIESSRRCRFASGLPAGV